MSGLVGFAPTGGNKSSAGASDGDIIKDGDMKSFGQDVMEASMTTPVLVDFWAPRCGPCKQLTPALEKVVKQARGAVKLVKINVDENQPLAQQLRIQSVPTVYVFFRGQPVDAFQGALPESQLKSMIDKLVQMSGGVPGGEDIESMLAAADEALADGDGEQALGLYQRVMQEDPEHTKAMAGTLRAMIAMGRVDEAAALMEQLPPELLRNPDLSALPGAIETARAAAAAAAQVAPLEARIAANPDDLEARFELAVGLFGLGKHQEAADTLLDLIKRDREWNDQAGRKQLLKFFDSWGPADPLTLKTRRKLSTLLFS